MCFTRDDVCDLIRGRLGIRHPGWADVEGGIERLYCTVPTALRPDKERAGLMVWTCRDTPVMVLQECRQSAYEARKPPAERI